MTNTTPNYGFVIPQVDGTDNVTPDLWRLPISAIDTSLKAVEGVWVDVSGSTLVTAGGAATMATGASIQFAKYRKVGKTVTFMGEASSTTLVSNVCVTLPNAATGVPIRRYLMCGQMSVYGNTPPADQTGNARMLDASKDRIVVHAYSGGFRDLPAAHSVMWLVTYEVV